MIVYTLFIGQIIAIIWPRKWLSDSANQSMSIIGLRFDSPRHRPHPLLQSENFDKCFIHVNLSSTDNWNRAGTSLVQQLCLPSPEHLPLCFGLTGLWGWGFQLLNCPHQKWYQILIGYSWSVFENNWVMFHKCIYVRNTVKLYFHHSQL